MIVYLTKESRERLSIPLVQEMKTDAKLLAEKVIEKESGDRLLEWGAKLFYFDRRKCLQVVNFASKLTLILVDLKVKDLFDIPNIMAMYMFEIYKNFLIYRRPESRSEALLWEFFDSLPKRNWSDLRRIQWQVRF